MDFSFLSDPRYNVLGAFWMTIQLTFWSAIGSFILGVILAGDAGQPGAADARLRHRLTSTSSGTSR